MEIEPEPNTETVRAWMSARRRGRLSGVCIPLELVLTVLAAMMLKMRPTGAETADTDRADTEADDDALRLHAFLTAEEGSFWLTIPSAF
jgi:hypothetical protein